MTHTRRALPYVVSIFFRKSRRVEQSAVFPFSTSYVSGKPSGVTTSASALAKKDPPVLSKNDPALATLRIFPPTLFL
jgi:hypothetical protein